MATHKIYYTNIGNAFCMQIGKNAYDYPLPKPRVVCNGTMAMTMTTATMAATTRMFAIHLCSAFCHLIYYSRWELNFERKSEAKQKRGKISINWCARVYASD